MNARVVIAILSAMLSAQSAAACLPYWPTPVTVSGKLERLTFPGLPNYESVRSGDEAETGFYLKLSTPICTVGDKSDGTAYPVSKVSLIQLILDSTQYTTLRPFLSRHLEIRGTLMAAHTGHHHAPVLIDSVFVVTGNGR